MFLDHNFKQPVNLFKVARDPASFGESVMHPAPAAWEDTDERKRRGKRVRLLSSKCGRDCRFITLKGPSKRPCKKINTGRRAEVVERGRKS